MIKTFNYTEFLEKTKNEYLNDKLDLELRINMSISKLNEVERSMKRCRNMNGEQINPYFFRMCYENMDALIIDIQNTIEILNGNKEIK